MNNTTDNLLKREQSDNDIIIKLAILSDELDLEHRYSDSQEIDDFIQVANMHKASSLGDILKLFKNKLKISNPQLKSRLQKVIDKKAPRARLVDRDERKLKDILDQQWGLTGEPSQAKDYTGELYP